MIWRQKIRLGLGELAAGREQMAPIIALSPAAEIGVIERAAACAMLHSFYTRIEKILKLVARERDGQLPSFDSWHKELLNQMAVPSSSRASDFV